MRKSCMIFLLMIGCFLTHIAFLEAQTTQGYSYRSYIPFATRENGMRTNLGLNNFSQFSFMKGASPSANVQITLYDQQGGVAGKGSYVVRSNELIQINDIISALGGTVGTGWLLILSDEPLDAWASVIVNSTSDPSIELSELFGRKRLMIQSSVKTASFQSSLMIVNVGSTSGNATVNIYDHDGRSIATKTIFLQKYGMYVDNDIRNSVSGTYGPIVIEANDPSVRLIANSIVKSANGTTGFFPAASLPATTVKSIAGIWEGSLIGTLINAQVRITLRQDRSGLFGVLSVLSGNFPTADRSLSILGFLRNDGSSDSYFLQADGNIDTAVKFFSFSLYAPPVTGTKMEGKILYVDETGQRDVGTISLSRTRDIFVQ